MVSFLAHGVGELVTWGSGEDRFPLACCFPRHAMYLCLPWLSYLEWGGVVGFASLPYPFVLPLFDVYCFLQYTSCSVAWVCPGHRQPRGRDRWYEKKGESLLSRWMRS